MTPQELLAKADAVRRQAHAPYSKYAVGAALLTRSGKVFTGCNVENASFGLSMCAERTAVFKAVSEGEKDFVAVAVVTPNEGTPCGACRQVMLELGGAALPVILGNLAGAVASTDAATLLPGAFVPNDFPCV